MIEELKAPQNNELKNQSMSSERKSEENYNQNKEFSLKGTTKELNNNDLSGGFKIDRFEKEKQKDSDIHDDYQMNLNNIDMMNLTEENKKMLFDSLKYIYSMKNQTNNMVIKNPDMERIKQEEELNEKISIIENEIKSMNKEFEYKENFYLEKIKLLESQINNMNRNDILLLQKSNKEYENQISVLNSELLSINKSQNLEKERFNSVVVEVMSLKDKLARDIILVESLKHEIINESEIEGISQDNNKTELIIKYNNEDVKKSSELRNDPDFFSKLLTEQRNFMMNHTFIQRNQTMMSQIKNPANSRSANPSEFGKKFKIQDEKEIFLRKLSKDLV